VDEDAELDALLAQFAAQDAALLTPKETALPSAPPPRAAAVFLPSPVSLGEGDELVLHGGEVNTGQNTKIYGELYAYSPKKNAWRVLVYPGPSHVLQSERKRDEMR
jgi:hypothetical protein